MQMNADTVLCLLPSKCRDVTPKPFSLSTLVYAAVPAPQSQPLEQSAGELSAMDVSRDGSMSPRSDGMKSGKRDAEEMNIQSPTDTQESSVGVMKGKAAFSQAMDTDSPSSYPKHVIVPSPPDSAERRQKARKETINSRPSGRDRYGSNRPNDNVVTPILSHEPAPVMHMYDRYRPPPGAVYYHTSDVHHYGPPPPGHYPPAMEMDMSPSYAMAHNVHLRPKRWACDYCNIATFLTFEDACAHEEACARRHAAQQHYGRTPPGYPPSPQQPPQQQQQQQQMYNSGLGALVHASREVQHYQPSRRPNEQGYPSPRFQQFRMTGHEGRDGAAVPHPVDPNQKRMLLALPNDSDSLSDRQCFVRTDFVEAFAATERDVVSRHSKGAQKLREGQVGIRCIHCNHLRPKDRAERAVCYPSSISRIYQTVADMQRFHFEQCTEIPEETRKIYKSLKTTRPRGVGSPQVYWISSAKLLNLVDTDEGIRFGPEKKEEEN